GSAHPERDGPAVEQPPGSTPAAGAAAHPRPGGDGLPAGPQHRSGSPARSAKLGGVCRRAATPPGGGLLVTWLLCDYGEVLCLAPSIVDRAALMAAADWKGAEGDFWQAYWADRPAYDRADLSVEEYWTRVLGYPPSAG